MEINYKDVKIGQLFYEKNVLFVKTEYGVENDTAGLCIDNRNNEKIIFGESYDFEDDDIVKIVSIKNIVLDKN